MDGIPPEYPLEMLLEQCFRGKLSMLDSSGKDA